MPVSRSRTGLALAGAALVLGASVASAQEFTPQLASGQKYLLCGSPSKEYVVGTFVNDDAGIPTWGDAAPASVTTGAGCGKLDDPAFSGTSQETPYTMAFKGTVKGNLDALQVTLHSADLGPGRAPGAPVKLAVRATVGGKSLFGFTENTSVAGDVVASPKDAIVELTPKATGATGGVRAYTLTITGIDYLTEADLLRKSGHEVVIDVRDHAPVETPAGARRSQNAHAWLWGASEAPSSVVLSPAAPSTDPVLVAEARSTRK